MRSIEEGSKYPMLRIVILNTIILLACITFDPYATVSDVPLIKLVAASPWFDERRPIADMDCNSVSKSPSCVPKKLRALDFRIPEQSHVDLPTFSS